MDVCGTMRVDVEIPGCLFDAYSPPLQPLPDGGPGPSDISAYVVEAGNSSQFSLERIEEAKVRTEQGQKRQNGLFRVTYCGVDTVCR